MERKHRVILGNIYFTYKKLIARLLNPKFKIHNFALSLTLLFSSFVVKYKVPQLRVAFLCRYKS